MDFQFPDFFLRNVGITGFTCWALLSPIVAWPVYQNLLFYPNCELNDAYNLTEIAGIPKQDVTIESTNGSKLHGWLFEKKDSKMIALVSHGNAWNLTCRDVVANALLRCGTSVLLYDYQGYGQSSGKPSVRNICDDGIAAYDFLISRGYKPENIILYGESLGCAVSTYVSSKRRTAGLILQSGFSSLPAIAREKFAIFVVYPKFLFPGPPLDNVEILKHPHPPLLVIHGENDMTIPVHHGRRVFNKAVEPKQLLVLKNTSHNDVFITERPEFYKAVNEFVQKLTPAKTVSPATTDGATQNEQTTSEPAVK